MSTVTCTELMSKFCNGVSINLWHYLDKIKYELDSLSEPACVWDVVLADVSILEHQSRFSVSLRLPDKSVELDHVDYAKGYEDGRIQVRQNGIWLDLSANGSNTAELRYIDTIVVDKRFVINPPPLRAGKTYTLKVGPGLTAKYASTNIEDSITIGIDRMYMYRYGGDWTTLGLTATVVDQGIRSINGATPIDGDITVRAEGDFEVLVTAMEVGG